MKCPKCPDSRLAGSAIGQIAVDRCESCRGIWFDAKELPALLNQDPATLRPLMGGKDKRQLTAKQGRCPRDTTVMLRVFSATDREVVLDTCPQCHGIWLDGGEFEALFHGR